jgi:hypothetical protein
MEFEITAQIKAVVVSEAKGASELRDRNRPEVATPANRRHRKRNVTCP